MRAKPKTTYVAASPQTWELIRGAYLSGLSAPTAAARFGVSVTALRKRAAREGWTKQAFARAQGPVAASSPGPPPPPGSMRDRVESVVERHMVSLHVRPEQLARRALGLAARAVGEGRGLEAQRLARAAREIAGLDQVLEPAGWGDSGEEDDDPDGRREHLRAMTLSIALNLAELIVAGKPLPPEFEALRAERAAARP